jgi:hypothetical protein
MAKPCGCRSTLIGSTVGVPTDVCGIDLHQAVNEAQREAADAGLGEVGLEHRGPGCHVSAAGGDRSAKLEANRFKDLLM